MISRIRRAFWGTSNAARRGDQGVMSSRRVEMLVFEQHDGPRPISGREERTMRCRFSLHCSVTLYRLPSMDADQPRLSSQTLRVLGALISRPRDELSGANKQPPAGQAKRPQRWSQGPPCRLRCRASTARGAP